MTSPSFIEFVITASDGAGSFARQRKYKMKQLQQRQYYNPREQLHVQPSTARYTAAFEATTPMRRKNKRLVTLHHPVGAQGPARTSSCRAVMFRKELTLLIDLPKN
jgi:hypothetical protein